jgi:hypothetical protein
MMVMTVFSVALVTLVAAEQDRKNPPSPDELAQITERGLLLAGYDQAAWHATDAVQKLNPNDGAVERYLARDTKDGWHVAFGKLNRQRSAFLIAYEASQGKTPQEYSVKSFDPPKQDTGFYFSAARAIDLALKDFIKNFNGQQRPYNVAILPAGDAALWVYLVPAPTREGIWPLGADVRFRMSADGSKILEKRQLHKSVIELPPPNVEGGNQLMMGTHTHVLDDIPEDTDVFHVLTRKPAVGELIITPRFVFQVETDGRIKFRGTSEKFHKPEGGAK